MAPYQITLTNDPITHRRSMTISITAKVDQQLLDEINGDIHHLMMLGEEAAQIIILDIAVPCQSGIEAIKGIKQRNPGIKILVLTKPEEVKSVPLALAAGADGLLLKKDGDKDLLPAIDFILHEGSPARACEAKEDSEASGDECAERSNCFSCDRLTAREMEIVKLIATGKTSKEIASQLFISARTVERHRANVLAKLGKHKSVDLVKYAIQNGYMH